MVNKKVIKKPLVAVLKRYTFEGVTKFANMKLKNLAELLSVFPNYGVGFKVFYKDEKDSHYIVDRVIVKTNRNAEIYGILFKNGVMSRKTELLDHVLKDNIWGYVPDSRCKTENGLEYDIKETEELINAKKQMMVERRKILGLPDPEQVKREELKKKKAEAAKAPKKKF